MKRGWVKGICAVLCVLLLNVGIWGCVLSGVWMIDWSEGGYWQSFLYNRKLDEYIDMVDEVINLKSEAQAGTLSAAARLRLNELTEGLDADKTNFRFTVSAKNGTVLYANAGDAEQWREQVYDVRTAVREYYVGDVLDDTVTGALDGEDLDDDVIGEFGIYAGSGEPVASVSGGGWMYYRVDCGVVYPLRTEDGFMEQSALYRTLNSWAEPVLAGSIVCCVAGLALLIALMCVAGRRKNREGVVLNWHDRIPYDLYLAAEITAQSCIWGIGFVEGMFALSTSYYVGGLLLAAGMTLLGGALILAFLLTTVSRVKARTLFRNTVIWRLCALLWRAVKWVIGSAGTALAALPLVWKAALVCGGYLVVGLLLVALHSIFLWFLLTAALLAYVCWWVWQWKNIRLGAQRIIGGDPGYQIDSGKMPPDLKEHADELNNLGQAISAAVDERMKSEHFKAELITNVSHDLKTPLTSIISYVDLLKKEEISSEKAREYIEVLDRKSQRLKKLTEDLVEASKASTGTLTVNRERLDLAQLIRQAQGECEEKLTAAGLSLVTALPGEPVYINADGRHVWRVLDNLLNNCAKYALSGTRIYLNLTGQDGAAEITVKNVSREPLNIPAEQLMERFVRGDESRATEGSGLGLSIARSLTELQDGRFRLEIDGDLFKAIVTFPLAGE